MCVFSLQNQILLCNKPLITRTIDSSKIDQTLRNFVKTIGWVSSSYFSFLFFFKSLNFTNIVVALFLKVKAYIKFLLMFTNHALTLFLELYFKL